MMKRVLLLFFVITSFIFTGCGNNTVYEKTIPFSNNKWPRIEEGKDIKFDKINIQSVDDPYDVYLTFKHTPAINEDEINVIFKLISPSGITKTSFHTILLKDSEGKTFIGDSMGEIIENRSLAKQYTYFPEKGEYTIIISNYNSKYETLGLKDIKLEIVKSDLDYNLDKGR